MKKILEDLKKAFIKGNTKQLKRISNNSLDQSVLNGNKKLVTISLVSYALYKMLTKSHYRHAEGWQQFSKVVIDHLERCIQNPESIEEILGEKLVKDLAQMDEQHGRFLGDLIDKAKVKQASRAYSLGLSLSSAIELTGAERFKVYSYVGITKIHEDLPSKGIAERYKYTESILEGK
ncbi:hypothetical protein K8R43_05660 [archaeon]|nr:hypothetical protein [archaeon]